MAIYKDFERDIYNQFTELKKRISQHTCNFSCNRSIPYQIFSEGITGSGLQNRGLKTFFASPSRQGKTYHAQLLKEWKTFYDAFHPSAWINLNCPALELPQNFVFPLLQHGLNLFHSL